MNSVLALNSDILNSVFAEWIDVSNLAVLDSSNCNTILRPQFLHIVSQSSYVQKASEFSKNNVNYLRWLVMRKIKVVDLSLEIVDDNCSKKVNFEPMLFNLNKLNHLRVNRFSNMSDCIKLLNGQVESVTFYIGYDDRQDFDFNDENLSSLLPSCNALKELILSNVTRIHDETCALIPKYLPHLESFGSKFCDNISGASLVAIARGCKKLRKAIVPDTVTDEEFEEILQHCPLLTHIEVSNCDGMADSALLRLPEFCPHLVSFVAETRYQLQDLTVITLDRKSVV